MLRALRQRSWKTTAHSPEARRRGRGWKGRPGLESLEGRALLNGTSIIGTLSAGRSISSPSGQYHLTMQSNGDLVESGPSGYQVIFSSGNPGAYAEMPPNGAFVVYSSTGRPLVAPSIGEPGDSLVIDDSGNLLFV